MWNRHAVMAVILLMASAGAAMAQTRDVTGSVTYRERIALPPGAVLDVRLQDVSLQDAPAKVLSADLIDMEGVPASFSLPYDPATISDRRSYSVQARITLDGKLLFISTSQNPVLTRGAAEHVDIVVSRVAVQSQTSLAGTDWTVEAVGDQPITLDRPPTISFTEDGNIAVFGGCNRFAGSFDVSDGGLNLSQNMAGTLMACPEVLETVERRFIDLLGKVERFESNGSTLTLSSEDGTVLVRARAGV